MSGNPDPFNDDLPPTSVLLLKPFGSRQLVARVRDVLGRPTLA